jgi:hypothetical protein
MYRMLEENQDRSEPTARAVRALLILSPSCLRSVIFLHSFRGRRDKWPLSSASWRWAYALAAGLNQLRSPKAAGDLWLLAMIHEADLAIMRAFSPVLRCRGGKWAKSRDGAIEMGSRTAFFLLWMGVVSRLIDGFRARAAVHRSRSWETPQRGADATGKPIVSHQTMKATRPVQ